MSSQTESETIEDLEKRINDSLTALERLKSEITKLPEPTFTSTAHQHTYDACVSLGLTSIQMKRAPSDYYEWPLEKRRNFLGAASIHQLCKTILLENTKGTAKDCSDRLNSRFYAVIIQYTSRLHTQNLFKFVRGLIPGSSRNNYHFRSAKPQDVAELTGAEFNGVCPVGNKVDIPIILSDRLLNVATGYMWVGGGEPELKLGFDVKEFIQQSGCFVASIAEDGLSLDGNTEESNGEDQPHVEPSQGQ